MTRSQGESGSGCPSSGSAPEQSSASSPAPMVCPEPGSAAPQTPAAGSAQPSANAAAAPAAIPLATTLDINEVMRRLPHRYPFLLVDRVPECIPGKSIRALKNVSINEPFFLGHFPNRPVMPGVLILEALAQAAGILAFVTAGVYPGEKRELFFAGIDKARFRRPVEPGDQLELHAELQRALRGIWKFATVARVNGVEVCSAEMMVAPGADT
jgi:3-hydroxyacyl-[acyl-carrier-protein] dehydratase